MEELFTKIEAFGPAEKLGWVFFCLTFFWVLEAVIPLFRFSYNKLRHVGINMIFFSFMLVINLIFGIIIVTVYPFIEANGFGIFNWVSMPFWAEFILAIMAFDLITQYTAHYLLHKVRWMWKLHLVHHSDTHVDATTGTRQHPVEFVLRESLAVLTIIVFGIPVGWYLFYRLVTVFFTYWTHANVKLPNWLDRALSFIVITPITHKFHHHFERPWTDSNFGNVLSIWDRIFGTFVYADPSKIQYGVDVVDNERDEDVRYQLNLPLDKSIKTDY
jgi:sterol desaturase/sphingolipid hydroxylase (fatty acid hydroxylase superfamily)